MSTGYSHRAQSGYDMTPFARNPLWSSPGTEGTFGVIEGDSIEWIFDDCYDDNIRGRVRAAMDFLDMHPTEVCVVEVGEIAGSYQTQRVCQVLAHDRRSGEFKTHRVDSRLVAIETAS